MYISNTSNSGMANLLQQDKKSLKTLTNGSDNDNHVNNANQSVTNGSPQEAAQQQAGDIAVSCGNGETEQINNNLEKSENNENILNNDVSAQVQAIEKDGQPNAGKAADSSNNGEVGDIKNNLGLLTTIITTTTTTTTTTSTTSTTTTTTKTTEAISGNLPSQASSGQSSDATPYIGLATNAATGFLSSNSLPLQSATIVITTGPNGGSILTMQQYQQLLQQQQHRQIRQPQQQQQFRQQQQQQQQIRQPQQQQIRQPQQQQIRQPQQQQIRQPHQQQQIQQSQHQQQIIRQPQQQQQIIRHPQQQQQIIRQPQQQQQIIRQPQQQQPIRQSQQQQQIIRQPQQQQIIRQPQQQQIIHQPQQQQKIRQPQQQQQRMLLQPQNQQHQRQLFQQQQRPFVPHQQQQRPLIGAQQQQRPLFVQQIQQRPLVAQQIQQRPLLAQQIQQRPLLAQQTRQRPLLAPQTQLQISKPQQQQLPPQQQLSQVTVTSTVTSSQATAATSTANMPLTVLASGAPAAPVSTSIILQNNNSTFQAKFQQQIAATIVNNQQQNTQTNVQQHPSTLPRALIVQQRAANVNNTGPRYFSQFGPVSKSGGNNASISNNGIAPTRVMNTVAGTVPVSIAKTTGGITLGNVANKNRPTHAIVINRVSNTLTAGNTTQRFQNAKYLNAPPITTAAVMAGQQNQNKSALPTGINQQILKSINTGQIALSNPSRPVTLFNNSIVQKSTTVRTLGATRQVVPSTQTTITQNTSPSANANNLTPIRGQQKKITSAKPNLVITKENVEVTPISSQNAKATKPNLVPNGALNTSSSNKIAPRPNEESEEVIAEPINNDVNDSNVESINVENETEEDNPEVDIVINNVVCTFSVGCHLNLREMALKGRNVEYRRENGMVTMKIRRPYTTASIWSSGRITCTGATSEDQAKIAARRYARIIQRLGFRAKFLNFRVVNVLGTCSMPWGIVIHNFSSFYKENASYEPELHPGVTYKLTKPKATLKIFSTGSITITAASVANVQAAVEHIFPLVHDFRNERTIVENDDLKQKKIDLAAHRTHLLRRSTDSTDSFIQKTKENSEDDETTNNSSTNKLIQKPKVNSKRSFNDAADIISNNQCFEKDKRARLSDDYEQAQENQIVDLIHIVDDNDDTVVCFDDIIEGPSDDEY